MRKRVRPILYGAPCINVIKHRSLTIAVRREGRKDVKVEIMIQIGSQVIKMRTSSNIFILGFAWLYIESRISMEQNIYCAKYF